MIGLRMKLKNLYEVKSTPRSGLIELARNTISMIGKRLIEQGFKVYTPNMFQPHAMSIDTEVPYVMVEADT